MPKKQQAEKNMQIEGGLFVGIFKGLAAGMEKTRLAFFSRLNEVFGAEEKIDEEIFEMLEDALIGADVGVGTSMEMVEKIRRISKEKRLTEVSELKEYLINEIEDILNEGEHELRIIKGSLNIILIVGVNGAGKTTSIGKLAYILKNDGYKVLAAAGDTFRAGAIEQLNTWCQRSGVDLIKHNEGADPAAVVFDAIQAAKSRKTEVLLIDTAGRLQNKTNLMEELKKIRRIVEREGSGISETLLVLDATMGQNALSQAKIFSEATGVTGVILTKLDGTAKGGVVLGIQNEYKLPIKYIGTGEAIDCLLPFDSKEFSKALLL